MLDGEAIPLGWVTFLPEDENAPIARAYVNRRNAGKFSIDQAHGPVAGKHRVEVHLTSRSYPMNHEGRYSVNDAERYTSARPGARAPLVLNLQPDQKITIDIRTK